MNPPRRTEGECRSAQHANGTALLDEARALIGPYDR